jgi:hypothetical protein
LNQAANAERAKALVGDAVPIILSQTPFIG